MPLGQLINFDAHGIEHGSQLNPRISSDIRSGKKIAKQFMKSYKKVPTTASSQDVINEAGKAANMEANVERVTKVINSRESQTEQALQLLKINISHADKMHGYSERYQKLVSQHSLNQLRHGENSGVIQAQNEGIYRAYTDGGSFDTL